jgi:beta-lactamase superfamily II metal-dependent hydrolase
MYNLNPLLNNFNQTFNGVEIDMLSLGDADSILVTAWAGTDAWRVLIDGGTVSNAKVVREFLRVRNANSLFAVVCTHAHNDHARGLIELLNDRSLTVTTGWMHDMRNHANANALRRASSGNSSQAEGVKEALETTKELASAFASRYITPSEPFAGQTISSFPGLTVLGPTPQFYQNALEESIGEPVPAFGAFLSALAAAKPSSSLYAPVTPPNMGLWSRMLAQPATPAVPLSFLGGPLTPPAKSPLGLDLSASLYRVLSKSSVEEKPKTQPFNNTSAILGMVYGDKKFLFTADAGSEALDAVPASWKNLHWMQVPHHGSDGNLSQRNIERFCPRFANVSAVGDSSHPDRAIVSGLSKVGAKVYSTARGHLWHWVGNVPARMGYGDAIPLKGNADPLPFAEWYPPVPGRL